MCIYEIATVLHLPLWTLKLSFKMKQTSSMTKMPD